MTDASPRVNEVFVLASIPEIYGNGLVRLSEPDKPIRPVPETLMIMEPLSDEVRRFLDDQHRREDWTFVRYVLTRTPGDWALVEGLEFGVRHRVPLDLLPTGFALTIRHIPLFAQPPIPTQIWPYWKLPPKKKWLVVPRRGAH